jgi:hypothetical protein
MRRPKPKVTLRALDALPVHHSLNVLRSTAALGDSRHNHTRAMDIQLNQRQGSRRSAMLNKFATITIAAAAGLGALAMSAPSASARGISVSFHGGGGHWGGHHGGGGHWGGRHWGHGYGYRYYSPVVYSSAYDCYYVRRRGMLFKVCD